MLSLYKAYILPHFNYLAPLIPIITLRPNCSKNLAENLSKSKKIR